MSLQGEQWKIKKRSKSRGEEGRLSEAGRFDKNISIRNSFNQMVGKRRAK